MTLATKVLHTKAKKWFNTSPSIAAPKFYKNKVSNRTATFPPRVTTPLAHNNLVQGRFIINLLVLLVSIIGIGGSRFVKVGSVILIVCMEETGMVRLRKGTMRWMWMTLILLWA